ncbi:glycosyltransferase family 2 protein [Flavivirga aquimarina]|uniref:Glycosyltransferase family 2 protein n=1 Tax=Flavivirga aquimarina TaxID=2027862 RepID=A0ABT8WCY2_9FLAO|nr:glycosyltransferase family 2 protein [Flavivirga aquimarina]MDO5970927.1 glycosyltransferase family 2 protein [Flavivirga aquimarina]
MTPFFSVVIPLYNKEGFIEETLKSVLTQSFKYFEIIIVNDGSTDRSEDIVNSFKDFRIKIFTIKNHGASHARNYGIKKASGNYIALLDADDFWYENHLLTIFHLINEFPDMGMYCSGYNILLGGKHYKKSKLKYIPYGYKGLVKNYFESNLYDSIVNSSAVVIPKYIFDNISFFDVDLRSGQDTYLWTQIALKNSVAINNIVTSIYVKNDNSLSTSKATEDRLLLLDKFIEQEKTNKSLKKFMDMNRYAVALNFKMTNNILSKSIYKNIDPNNLSLKQKTIFLMPKNLLRYLYSLKTKLDRKGIFFYLYR